MFRTIDRPGGKIGSVTFEGIAAAQNRILLADVTLEANAASLEWPTIFDDNPEFEYFEAEFEGNGTSNLHNLYMRYFTKGREYATSPYQSFTLAMSKNSQSGWAPFSASMFCLHSEMSSDHSFGFRVRFHPNNSLPNNRYNYAGKHPFTARADQFGPTSYPIVFSNGGFQAIGNFPATVSGFKFYPSHSAFSAGSVIRVYGLKSAGTVVV